MKTAQVKKYNKNNITLDLNVDSLLLKITTNISTSQVACNSRINTI